MEYDSFRQRHVLLSIGAGVWLGNQRDSPHPPGEAGGFHFLRFPLEPGQIWRISGLQKLDIH
jgi:hypothetical protein